MRRRKAEQKKESRKRKMDKRLLELERQRKRNRTIISNQQGIRDQQEVVNVVEENYGEMDEEKEEEREFPSTPAFSVGEVVSITGDTTQRGY